MGILWTLFQPMLFGLIGAEVKVSYLDKNLVASGIGTLCVGLVVRCLMTYVVVMGNGLNVKEKVSTPLDVKLRGSKHLHFQDGKFLFVACMWE